MKNLLSRLATPILLFPLVFSGCNDSNKDENSIFPVPVEPISVIHHYNSNYFRDIQIADMNGDSHPDIVQHFSSQNEGRFDQYTYVFLNDGKGNYVPQKANLKPEAFNEK